MILKIIFYMFWVFYLVYQTILLFNIKKHVDNTLKTMDELEQETQDKKDGKVVQKSAATLASRLAFVFHILFGYGALVFRFIGLMTTNWFIFLAWLIWDFALSPIPKHLRENKKIKTYTVVTFTFVFEFIDVLLTIFVILNAFHFHITFSNLLSYIL